jgi:putative peptidoglycan lipid II flippase
MVFKANAITSAGLILGVSAVISRALALVRDRLLAGTFGAGPELDVYFAAFRIPDFLFAFFVLGAVSAAFLPLFTEYREQDAKEAWNFVSNLMNVLFVGLAVLAFVALVFAPQLVRLVGPGFTQEQLTLATSLVRVMLLSPIIFGLSSIVSGVLQYFGKFLAYAVAPIVYNLGIIFGIVFFVPMFGIMGLAYGVVLGALFHLFVQLPFALRVGLSFQKMFHIDAGVKRVIKLALPRTIGGAAYQINVITMTALASLLTSGSIATFTFADNLHNFPVGIVGVPLALAAFPVLSRATVQKDKQLFFSSLLRTLAKIVGIVFPLSVVLFVFREQIISFIFQTGAFSVADAKVTATIFGVFCFGIVFQAVIPLLVRTFFSLQDTKTPTLIGVFAVLFNIVLALLFLNLEKGILALPLALVLSGAGQALLLAMFLMLKLQKVYGEH